MKNPESVDKNIKQKSIWDPDHELSKHITTIQVDGRSYQRIEAHVLTRWDSEINEEDQERKLGYRIFYGHDPAKFVQDPYEPKKRGRKRFK